VLKFFKSLRLITPGPSLGGVESIATYPIASAASPIPDEDKRKLGIKGLIIEGGYALTPKGEAVALEVATWSTGYAGYMRQLVERCVKLYLALGLLAWAR